MSKRARNKFGEEEFFLAPLDFFPSPLTAPVGSPRTTRNRGSRHRKGNKSFRPKSKSFRPKSESFRPNFKVVSFKVICDVFTNY